MVNMFHTLAAPQIGQRNSFRCDNFHDNGTVGCGDVHAVT